MSKRKYIIAVFLGFVVAFFCSDPIFSALESIVLPDHVTPVVVNPAGGLLAFFRFSLPFGLACVAIPISFMIIRNHFRAAVIVVLSLVLAGAALLVLRLRVYASVDWYEQYGFSPMILAKSLRLEAVPWVSFGVMVIGTFFLKMKKRGADARPVPL